MLGTREQLSVALPCSRRAPAVARATLRSFEGRLGPQGATVGLLVSELVANAVRHGEAGERGVIELKVTLTPDRIRVDVVDQGRGFTPPGERHRPSEHGGYGLMITARLSSRWGVREGAPTRVWFEIDRASTAPAWVAGRDPAPHAAGLSLAR
jgi:anti-sigma regulatory factor (Ser/Thr protein kinase)